VLKGIVADGSRSKIKTKEDKIMRAERQHYILQIMLIANPRLTVGEAGRRLNKIKKALK